MTALAFALGLFAGASIGVVLGAVLNAARQADECRACRQLLTRKGES